MSSALAARRPGLRVLAWVVALLVGLSLATWGVASVRRHGHERPEEVRPGSGIFRVRNFFGELYGFRCAGRVIVIDAGLDPAGHALDALLATLKATRDEVTDVFLTHGHFDHIAAAPLCKHARIHLGIGDTDMASKRAPMEPRSAGFFGHFLPTPPVFATDAFLDRTTVPIDGEKSLLALPLPGHTPGSYLYLYDGTLFAGDSIQIHEDELTFANPGFSVDLALSKRGIASLPEALGAAAVQQICTGHQGCTPPERTTQMLEELIRKAKRP